MNLLWSPSLAKGTASFVAGRWVTDEMGHILVVEDIVHRHIVVIVLAYLNLLKRCGVEAVVFSFISSD